MFHLTVKSTIPFLQIRKIAIFRWFTYIFTDEFNKKLKCKYYFLIPHYLVQLPKKTAVKKQQWWKNKLTAETAFIYFTEFGKKNKTRQKQLGTQQLRLQDRWCKIYIPPCSMPSYYSGTYFSFAFTLQPCSAMLECQ